MEQHVFKYVCAVLILFVLCSLFVELCGLLIDDTSTQCI